jgi:hypothetical protein
MLSNPFKAFFLSDVFKIKDIIDKPTPNPNGIDIVIVILV